MITWKKQGAAWVGALSLVDGRTANVVVVGGPKNAKGAALLLASEVGGPPQTLLLNAALTLLHPQGLIDILCMQERAFGSRGLPAPEAP